MIIILFIVCFNKSVTSAVIDSAYDYKNEFVSTLWCFKAKSYIRHSGL